MARPPDCPFIRVRPSLKLGRVAKLYYIGPRLNFVFCFNSDLNNVLAAIYYRMVYYKNPDGDWVLPPLPQPGAWSRLSYITDRLAKIYRGSRIPISFDDVVAQYDGNKKLLMQEAKAFREMGIATQRETLEGFPKRQKEEDAPNKPAIPRAIVTMKRPRMQNLVLGSFLNQKTQACVYKALDYYYSNPSGGPVCYKSLNLSDRAKHMRRAWLHYTDPAAYIIDLSRCDQSITTDALNHEHNFWKKLFGNDAELQRILSYQHAFRVQFRLREATVTVAGPFDADHPFTQRTSGCMNTSVGNTLIVLSASFGFVDYLKRLRKGLLRSVCNRFRVDIINDGDDEVFIGESDDIRLIAQHIAPFFLTLGLRVSASGTPITRFEEIEFCQTHPVNLGTSQKADWVMIRNPLKALSHDMSSTLDIEKCSRGWAALVASCGLHLTGGCPVMQSFYHFLARYADGAPPIRRSHQTQSGFFRMAEMMTRKSHPITQEARYSFFLAFGISVPIQLALEDHYDHMVVRPKPQFCGFTAAQLPPGAKIVPVIEEGQLLL